MYDRWEAEERLAAQHPQDDSHYQTHSSSTAVGHLEEEDADQLGEHDGVRHVHTHKPEDQHAAVQEGETSSSQTHGHYRDADDPLHFTVGCLVEKHGTASQTVNPTCPDGDMLRSNLFSDNILVDVGGKQRGRGEEGRVHGGHDGSSHSSDSDDGDIRRYEILQGYREDGARLVPLVWGR